MTWSARRACAARQRRVVAPDLGAGALGVIEKVQIVDRHDLRGLPRRNQQRMRGVHDVERPAREPLDRRPVQPVPREVQEPDRHAPIDDRRRPGRRPASRSFQDDENRLRDSPAGAVATSARASSWTYSPTPVRCAKRGPVVEQNPHGANLAADGYHARFGTSRARCNSLSVNRLTAFRRACYV